MAAQTEPMAPQTEPMAAQTEPMAPLTEPMAAQTELDCGARTRACHVRTPANARAASPKVGTWHAEERAPHRESNESSCRICRHPGTAQRREIDPAEHAARYQARD